jgi:hypothetical protein
MSYCPSPKKPKRRKEPTTRPSLDQVVKELKERDRASASTTTGLKSPLNDYSLLEAAFVRLGLETGGCPDEEVSSP